jgi:hypothetical protein
MASQPPRIAINIRGVDSRLWREVRLEATRRIVPTAQVFDEIVREWLERRAASSPEAQNGGTTAGTR